MPHTMILAESLASLVDPDADFAQEDLLDVARRFLKLFVETSLDLELTAYLGCGRHARDPERRSYRNGAYTRDLTTGLGLLQELRVPRCRDKGFVPRLFARYERRQKRVDQLMRTLFFLGVSTRGVGEALEVLLGVEPSPATVSAVVAALDAQVKAYHQRKLSDDYLYLFLDGVTMTVKELPHAVKRLVLVAYGITRDGHRVLLDYKIVPSESAEAWERFLTDLYQRGVKGEHLRLITTDGGQGVRAAVPRVYGEVPQQLCWAHKLRNVSGYLKKEHQIPCLRQAAAIYRAAHRREARKAWEAWQQRWEAAAPKAVACLARDLEALLCFLDCPAEHHRVIRTTNYIERLFREVRRRTRLMGAFANKASCDRMLFGTLTRINRNWSRKALPGFTH